MLGSRTEGALKDKMAPGMWARAALCCCLLAASSACSAIWATLECRRAERELARTPSVASDAANVYQLTLARAYLDKAREEAAEAHYGTARDLARAAKQATESARRSKGRSE